MPQRTKQKSDDKIFSEIARQYIVPLMWKSIDGGPRSGTMFFYHTGKRVIGITAHHVYKKYTEDKKNNVKLLCNVNNNHFDLKSRIIDLNEQLDLITFNFKTEEVTSLINTQIFHSDGRWPPQSPKEHECVFFAGFPGQDRKITGSLVRFHPYFIACFVHGVSDKYITCQIDRSKMEKVDGMNFPPEGHDQAGVSGAPLFFPCYTSDKSDLMLLKLAGIIYESYSINNGNTYIIYATKIDKILSDGTIDNSLCITPKRESPFPNVT